MGTIRGHGRLRDARRAELVIPEGLESAGGGRRREKRQGQRARELHIAWETMMGQAGSGTESRLESLGGAPKDKRH